MDNRLEMTWDLDDWSWKLHIQPLGIFERENSAEEVITKGERKGRKEEGWKFLRPQEYEFPDQKVASAERLEEWMNERKTWTKLQRWRTN